MALLLLGSEAACLVPQHKQIDPSSATNAGAALKYYRASGSVPRPSADVRGIEKRTLVDFAGRPRPATRFATRIAEGEKRGALMKETAPRVTHLVVNSGPGVSSREMR